MAVLSTTEIAASLKGLPGWELKNSELARRFSFTDFREAMSFVNAVAVLAEAAGHHPDIDIRYNKVDISLSSHDAGGITEKDFALAKQIAATL